MTSKTWEQSSVSLTSLMALARLQERKTGAFEFLRLVGVVPSGVRSMPAAKVRLSIDPEAVPAGYLASSAYEWDTWGESRPEEFIEAIKTELNPIKRDFIAAILTSLGRAVTE